VQNLPYVRLFPLRQFFPRADLKPQLHRQRADHDGGGLWGRGARPVLRRGRGDSRRSCRTTCCRSWGCSPWSRRLGAPMRRCGVRRTRSSAAPASRPGAWSTASSGATGRAGRRPGLAGRDLRGRPAPDRLAALGGGALLHPGGQALAGHRDRGGGRAAASAAGPLSRGAVTEPHPVPPGLGGRDRHRGTEQDAR
jgi:hypothetical protein